MKEATPALEGDVTYRLIVEASGKPAVSRALALPVNHRDRFVNAGLFASALHSAVELPDGSVLIVGGWRGASVNSNSIDRFDPARQAFSQVGAMATGRALSRLVVLADGNVLVAGGATSVASGVTYELFDPRTGLVSPAGIPIRNRLGHTATRLLDGRVFIAGGLEQDTAEIWDPVTRTARPVAARMNNPREWHTATLLADGRVLLVGGYTLASAYWLAEIFDPRTEQFTPVGTPRFTSQVEALALHSAHRLSDGSVLVAGGELFNPAVGGDSRPTTSVLRFDPVTGALTPLSGLHVPRTLMTAVALADDRLLMSGGITVGESYTVAAKIAAPAGEAAVFPLKSNRLRIASGIEMDSLSVRRNMDDLDLPVNGKRAVARTARSAARLDDGAVFHIGAPGTRSMTVTSGGARNRMGGPHVPEPLLT